MLLETMDYSAFFMSYCLEVDPPALIVSYSRRETTSKPDSNHSASECTARQYTAEIFGGFIALLTGVERSSMVRVALGILYQAVPRSPSTIITLQPRVKPIFSKLTFVTLSTKGCF